MIIKNKLFKFSSLCIIGSISILVNQMMPSSTSVNGYDVANQNGTSGVNSGYTLEASEEDDVSAVSGDSITSIANASTKNDEKTNEDSKKIEDEDTPTEAQPEATEEAKEEEEDPNAIPGINYKDYIDMNNYKNLGIANVEKYLNVRKEANTNSTIIAKMPPNAGCTITETETNSANEVWCHIKSGNVEGYVMKDFLITGDDAQKMVASVGHLVIKVDCQVLNVREKASTDASVLYQISEGEELEIVSVTDKWIEVTVDIGEETGFVAREYVNIAFTLEKAIDVDELLVGCSTERAQLVAYAKEFLGNPYVYGGMDLYNGIDCSGFTKKIYAKFGYTLNRTSRDQASSDGVKITESQLQPGDLVFYANSSGTVKHVAIFIGNGKIIHASNPRDGIKISNMKYTTPYRYKSIFKN